MVADDKWIVLAYVIPFVTWVKVTTDDFVGNQLRTLGESRRLGRVHLGLICVPLFYLVYVVRAHAAARDYKTMSMALLALVFVLLHLARTFFCLWQLAALREWLIASLARMERHGYAPVAPPLPPSLPRAAGAAAAAAAATAAAAGCADGARRRALHADGVLVRGNLVDGIWNAGGVRCALRLLGRGDLARIHGQATAAGGAAAFVLLVLSSALRVPRVLAALVLSEGLPARAPGAAPLVAPLRPEVLWVRWAATLASHFPNWTRDVQRARRRGGGGGGGAPGAPTPPHHAGATTRRAGPPRRPRAADLARLRAAPPPALQAREPLESQLLRIQRFAAEHRRRADGDAPPPELDVLSPRQARILRALLSLDGTLGGADLPSVPSAAPAAPVAAPAPPPESGWGEEGGPGLHSRGTCRALSLPAGSCPRHQASSERCMLCPEILNCRACKQGMLARVVKSGNGLPLGLPHHAARNVDLPDAPVGYDMFGSEFDRAKAALPMGSERHVLPLNVHELEWLAVFLGA